MGTFDGIFDDCDSSDAPDDPEKLQARSAILNEISQETEMVSGCDEQIEKAISYIDYILTGSTVGHDDQLEGYCKRSREQISQAKMALQSALETAGQINVKKREGDGGGNGGTHGGQGRSRP